MLVNNAGYWEIGPTAQISEAGFDAMFAINVKGPFFLTAAFAPAMAARRRGAIVNVSTMVAVRGAAGMAAYGASKAALESLTRSGAAEFGPAGVRVNAVALGPTHTPGTASMADMLKTLADARPLRRVNEPSDVADAIRYLLSDTANSITGAVLPVDGGRVAALPQPPPPADKPGGASCTVLLVSVAVVVAGVLVLVGGLFYDCRLGGVGLKPSPPSRSARAPDSALILRG